MFYLKNFSIISVIAACTYYPIAQGQVVINEIVSSNTTINTDEDNSYQDWIELFNAGSDPINLAGYGLSDNPAQLFKWVFPDYTLDPGEYLLVWASGKNRNTPKNSFINGISREVYHNIPGVLVADLLSHPNYPNQPSSRNIVHNFFESPRNIGDHYGQRMFALLKPPMTGQYTFWISGDDQCQIWLSTDDSPSNLRMIATNNTWTHFRQWDRFSQQRSQPIFLESEKHYFVLVLMKENRGDDHVSVRWQLPDGRIEEPLEVQHCYIQGGMLHTNFRISSSGEPIILTDPNGNIVDEAPAVPIPTNISLGRIPNGIGPFLLIDKPTPGQHNADIGYSSRLEPPTYVTKSGNYEGSIQVIIESDPADAAIYYTLDGSIPNENNAILYNGPFEIQQSHTVRAISAKAEYMSSEVTSATFNILEPILHNFTSNLPLMIINQYDIPISPEDKSIAYLTLVDKPDATGRFHLMNDQVFQSRINIEIRGSSSQFFPKKGYGFHLFNEDESNNKQSLLGMPAEHNWVLHGPYSDKSLMRNNISYELAREMGSGYHPRTHFIELFLHDGNGPITQNHYHGVYLLVERIKIAEGRLELAELEPHHNTEPEISGGYIFKKDRLNPGETGIYFGRGIRYAHVRPQEDRISIPQRNWITQHLSEFDALMMSENFADPVNGYKNYIDPLSFIDYHLITEITKQIDGYRLSTFFYKDRGGKIHLGPIWDYNLSWGNANYYEGWMHEGWYYPLIEESDYLDGWFNKLFQDPDFQKNYKRRYWQLRKNVFSNENITHKLRTKQAYLREAAERNFVRWPVLGTYVWPNWFIAQTYDQEIDWMESWILQRLAWIDQMLADTLSTMHYWNFNQSSTLLDPTFTIGGASLNIDLGDDSEFLSGTGQGFTGINARFGDQAGSHLRINNPIGTTLLLSLPTKNYEKITLTYEARRSNNGANRQYLSYTVDGIDFIPLDTLVITDQPTLFSFDFSDSSEISDNNLFAVKIYIDQIDDGTGGDAGNQRIDNISLDGIKLEGSNSPPSLIDTISFIELISFDQDTVIDLAYYFEDPDNDPLLFEVFVDGPDAIALNLDETILTLSGTKPGSTVIRIEARDPTNLPVSMSFPVLIYPTAHSLADSPFMFDFWSPDEPEFTYPDHMIFLQSDKNDPELEDELRYAYYIPHNDYAPGDQLNIGFPYRNESRTRINGLNEKGISLINTGRGRDLGAVVVNVNTQNLQKKVTLNFLSGTLRSNSRAYHLRLFYRKGLMDNWNTFVDENNDPIEYQRADFDDHVQYFENILFNQELEGIENLLLMWKYYYTGIQTNPGSGQRDMIRLDDILIKQSTANQTNHENQRTQTLTLFPNPNSNEVIYFNKITSGVIINGMGQVQLSVENQDRIDTTHLPPGMYIFRSTEGETLKFIQR